MKACVIAIVCLVFCAHSINAEELNPDLLNLKKDLIGNGFTSCTDAVVNTFNFLTKETIWSNNKRWYTSETDNKPYYIYYITHGNDKSYASTGYLEVHKGIDGDCWGSYSKTTVYPSITCDQYMSKNSYNIENGWKINNRGKNGDGGEFYFMEIENSDGLKFILNDSSSGCIFTKMEAF